MAFRLLCKRLAKGELGLLVSEFVSIEGIAQQNPKDLAMLNFLPEERPFCMQIFGADPDKMAAAALQSQKLGADFLEINVGCPVPKVVKKGGGSGLLKDLPLLKEIVKKVRQAIEIPLSIKVRTGWDDETINVLESANIAEGEGCDLFIIHGRTRKQGYMGMANWEHIGEVKQSLSIPVIGNGDIKTAIDAQQKLRDYGVDGVSIGRGVLHNPWVFQEIAQLWKDELWTPPNPTEQTKMFRTYADLLTEQGMTDIRVLGRLKQLGARLMKAIPNSAEIRSKILRSQSLVSFVDHLNDFYDSEAGHNAIFRPDLVENLNGGKETHISEGCHFKK